MSFSRSHQKNRSKQELLTNLAKVKKFQPLIKQKSIVERKSESSFDGNRSDRGRKQSLSSLSNSQNQQKTGKRNLKKSLFEQPIKEVNPSNYNTHKSNQDFLEIEKQLKLDKKLKKGTSGNDISLNIGCVWVYIPISCIIYVIILKLN